MPTLCRLDARGVLDERPVLTHDPAGMLALTFGLVQMYSSLMARIEKRWGKEVVVKTDDRGRTIDIHAPRHTFGTHLLNAGVPLRTALAAMRHSDPSLTANVYTDPKLLDMAGAVASLPDLPLAEITRPAAAMAAR